MRIASWNVNSVRARFEQLTGWLDSANPDVVCLQETKVVDEKFPMDPLAEAGYRAVYTGEKTYNGVAILARHGLAIEHVVKRLDGDGDDAHKRFLACTIEGLRIVNVYVPNGQEVGAPAFGHKLSWLRRLREHLDAHETPSDALLLCGDFNVAPEAIDVHDPKRWEGKVLFHPDERAALRHVMEFGLVDAFRAHHPEPGQYSWWDYRMGAFRRNAGLRIDLALLTPALAERCVDVHIDRSPRGLEKPSDHAPVVVELGA
jgi:exodeoxyribonuclease-3